MRFEGREEGNFDDGGDREAVLMVYRRASW